MFVKLAKKILFYSLSFFIIFSFLYFFLINNSSRDREVSYLTFPELEKTNGTLSLASDFDVRGNLIVGGISELLGGVKLSSLEVIASEDNKFLTLDSDGRIAITTNEGGIVYLSDLPDPTENGVLYSDGDSWLVSDIIYQTDKLIGLSNSTPSAKLHIKTAHSNTVGLIVQGEKDQSANLQEWENDLGTEMVRITSSGKMIFDNSADHQLEIRPSGDTGYLSSSGGAIYINNSSNIGTGIGIYSNAGSDALGNMINVKVDNPAFAQAAFYMNYDGISNAVEIVSNTNDSSSNALSITNNNQSDSAIGVIGYETGRGTIKVSHVGTGSDSSASGLSIDLQGTGTAAQGVYVDSTASGGTSGNLLRLRNQTLDRFVVSSVGSLSLGRNGTNTTITKYGNTSGDEFFVGTNAAFRIQRSATNSEAFRTQIVGDTQGRWLGTSDGKLKFGDGSSAQDVTLERTAAGLFHVDSDITITSQATDNDVLTLTASDGSQLGRFTETASGHGSLEIDNSSGTSTILFSADGTASYINSGNFGIGTTSFGTNAAKVISIGNGTAPDDSIADGIQLWAEDVTASSELRVRDEAGNVSTLSPHNFSLIPAGPSEEMAWSFYSERENFAINADITKALRIVEDLSGENLVFIKNLSSGEPLDNPKDYSFKNVSETDREEISKIIDEKLTAYTKREDLQKYASLLDKVWTFLSQVVFKAKAIFESSATFLANVNFGGNITVNADTSGTITVPSGTSKFKVNFIEAFEQKPNVYISSSDSSIKYKLSQIEKEFFVIEIENALREDSEFQWLALISNEGNVNKLEIMETSKESKEVDVEETQEEASASAQIELIKPEAQEEATESSFFEEQT